MSFLFYEHQKPRGVSCRDAKVVRPNVHVHPCLCMVSYHLCLGAFAIWDISPKLTVVLCANCKAIGQWKPMLWKDAICVWDNCQRNILNCIIPRYINMMYMHFSNELEQNAPCCVHNHAGYFGDWSCILQSVNKVQQLQLECLFHKHSVTMYKSLVNASSCVFWFRLKAS